MAALLRCPVHEWGPVVVSKLFGELRGGDLAVDSPSMMPAGVASVESLQQVLKNQNEQLARSNLQTGDQVGQCCWVVVSWA